MARSYSLRETIDVLDLNKKLQPRSGQDLSKRLRWEVAMPGGEPQGPISLRKIAKRVKGPDTVRLRFLSYNTYLLPGLRVPIGRWLDDAIGWDALAWFGIPFGGPLLAMLGLTSLPNMAIGTILQMAGWTPRRVIQKIAQVDINEVLSLGAKPALDERASELGRVVLAPPRYDVCCLCEVFTDDTRSRILEASRDHPWERREGPDDSGEQIFLGSGLLFLARTGTIVKTAQKIFANRGNRIKDSDAWANKGVLLNVLDIGFGQLEFFQTHLYYGGGLPGLPEPSENEVFAVRQAQLSELADFYREHHNPENIGIITGDFNMNGADIDGELAAIQRILGPLQVRDLWRRHTTGNHIQGGLTCRYTDGPEDANEKDFRKASSDLLQEAPANLLDPAAAGTLTTYCADDDRPPGPPRKGVGRFDYILVEEPTAAHRFHLEVSRMLRRPFPRAQSTGGEAFLSDHLGLEVTLFLSPRG